MTVNLWVTLISAVLGSGALTAVVTAALTAHRERKKAAAQVSAAETRAASAERQALMMLTLDSLQARCRPFGPTLYHVLPRKSREDVIIIGEKKMGRPTENPRTEKIGFRLSKAGDQRYRKMRGRYGNAARERCNQRHSIAEKRIGLGLSQRKAAVA